MSVTKARSSNWSRAGQQVLDRDRAPIERIDGGPVDALVRRLPICRAQYVFRDDGHGIGGAGASSADPSTVAAHR
ncbi:hypothetical protein [Nocardia sp. NPDC004860]|uniref:hypothetical protein n=1 Tax=Nocardia sp. NPDC004860 TaxID=3154557 RepID=UPI0033AD9C5B